MIVHDVAPAEHGVNGTEKRMGGGIKVLWPYGGKANQANAIVFPESGSEVVPAIGNYVMASLR